MNLPVARTAGLLEQEADNELLVYDLQISKAYTLNETSKNVFKACHKESSFEDLKRRHNYTNDVIYLALDELKKHSLIESDYVSPFAGINRREVIRRAGLAGMFALPVVTGIVAPQVINAASTCSGSTCSCNCNSTAENCDSVVGVECGTDPNGYVTLGTPCATPGCRCVAAPFGQADNCVS